MHCLRLRSIINKIHDKNSPRQTWEWENKAAQVLSYSLSPHPSHTDFISHFLLPLFLSQLNQVDELLAVCRTMSSSRRNLGLEDTEWKCHRIRKGKMRKHQWKTGCRIQAEPPVVRISHTKQTDKASFWSQNTSERLQYFKTLPWLLCFLGQDCTVRGKHAHNHDIKWGASKQTN